MNLGAVCEQCGINEAKGSVGSFIDSSFIQWICEECYNKQFKSLSECTTQELQSITEMIRKSGRTLPGISS